MNELSWKWRSVIAGAWIIETVILWGYLLSGQGGFGESGGSFHVFGTDLGGEKRVMGRLLMTGVLMAVFPIFSGKTWVRMLSAALSFLWASVFLLGTVSQVGQAGSLGFYLVFLALLAVLGPANVVLNVGWLLESGDQVEGWDRERKRAH